ncbi:DUF6232 family protein [Micromonospora zhanjiangensis]|uniref:DUF6232 family protein n=1 Tax=Micromonospora zhanjiangensis TaxID=1522057 RepID=A0ABV8KFV2_9ACTN
MTVYYRDTSAQVTSESIHANGMTVRIADITFVWHDRGRGTARVRSRIFTRGVLIVLLSLPPLVALVCVVALAYSAQARGRWGLAIAILAVCLAAALALTPFMELPLGWLDRSYSRGSAVQELWVQHNGQELMLLRTEDAHRFGQIYRALQRAVEQQGGD